MKIAILTSSRADYGIYLPLLKKLRENPVYDLRIIAFGTHLSQFHGYTVTQIEKDGFTIDHKVETVLASDTKEAIATSIGLTQMKFADIWSKEDYDLIFCLGDRYEMFAAVAAGIPFNLKFVHLHGGETTLGAIDNQFRHAITVFSTLHFTATAEYARKVTSILGSSAGVYNVGALSLDNLKDMPLYSKEEFKAQYGIDMDKPTILVTFHPETVMPEDNISYAEILNEVFNETSYQIVLTLPNADTSGNAIRRIFIENGKQNKNIHIIENFGTKGYFSCMQHCAFLLGNTSSGIIEAASFGKYVINLGERQKGRAASDNLISVRIEKNSITAAISEVGKKEAFTGENIYYKGNVATAIINILEGL